MLGTLLRYRLKMALSMFKGGKKFGFALLLLLAFAALAFALTMFSYGIYKFAQLEPEAGGRMLENLIALSFHGMFAFLLFWGMSLVVFSIFFSNDIELLLSLPIKTRDIFIFKVGEATFQSLRLSAIFLVPSLIVFGLHSGAGVSYYLVALVVSMAVAAIPGSLGIVIATVISRRIPRARLKGILTVTGSLIGITLWAFFNNFSRHLSSDSGEFGTTTMKTMELAASPALSYLPSGWAYKATTAAAKGDPISSLPYLLILLVLSGGLLYLALTQTGKYFAGGVVEEIASQGFARDSSAQFGGSPLMAHIRRDIILLSRESGVLMQALIMAAFLLLFPFISPQGNIDEISVLPFSPVGALFAAFFGGQIGCRLIPLERLGFWQNLASPGGRRLTLISKLIVGFTFVTLISIGVSVVHLAAGKMSGVTPIFYVVAFAWTGLAVGIPVSVFFANFNWDHPKRMLKGGGGFIYALSIMVSALSLYGALFLAGRFISHLVHPIIVIMGLVLLLVILAVVVAQIKLMNMEWAPDV